MNQELLRPSLRQGGVRETKSYDIGHFLYVGFFGGVLPVLVLGTVNGFWLRACKKRTILLFLIGLGLMASAFFYACLTGAGRDAFLFSRVAAVLLAIGYRAGLKKRYRLHSVLNGKHRPLAKPAVSLVVASLLIEMQLVRMGEGLHDASVGR